MYHHLYFQSTFLHSRNDHTSKLILSLTHMHHWKHQSVHFPLVTCARSLCIQSSLVKTSFSCLCNNPENTKGKSLSIKNILYLTKFLPVYRKATELRTFSTTDDRKIKKKKTKPIHLFPRKMTHTSVLQVRVSSSFALFRNTTVPCDSMCPSGAAPICLSSSAEQQANKKGDSTD